MAVAVTRAERSRIDTLPGEDMKLGFGRFFTDHMYSLKYAPDKGWHDGRIEPYHSLDLDPAAMCLHYGQEIFEGLKAYHGKDDGIYLFRHEANLGRMNRSASRLCMPELDIAEISAALKELILLDKDWIPTTKGCALYIRPTMISTDPFLGVRPSSTYLFYIILSPVAAYYPEGFNPVSIYVSDHYVRAVKGGIGEAKAAGNYAASLCAQMAAKKKGYTQVLWLDAKERKYIEEVGTMNIMFKMGDEVVTSPLTGSILPGITRDSVLSLLRKWGVKVTERMLSIDEVMGAAKDGTLTEVYGTGTAAIISPVKEIAYKDEVVTIGDGTTGELSRKLYEELLDIQYGYRPEEFGWVERIA